MIPLSYFLIGWVILLAIFGVMMLLTLIQMLRHGLPTIETYLVTFAFLFVTAVVVVGTALLLARVDWNAPVQILPDGVPGLFSESETL